MVIEEARLSCFILVDRLHDGMVLSLDFFSLPAIVHSVLSAPRFARKF